MDPDPAVLAAGVETLTLNPPISDPLFSPIPSDAAAALPSDAAALHDLAARGQWRLLLEKISHIRTLPHPPHAHLIHLTFHVLTLLKLHRPADAAAELDSLPPFSNPRFLFSSHPDIYPNLSGSMLPFALRFLHAILPSHLSDRPLSLDRLYTLLAFTRSRSGPHWTRREAFILSSIFCNHFSHREFDIALALIRSLLNMYPDDPVLLSRLAYIQMQIGDVDAAKATFSVVEELSVNKGVELESLVGRNRALVLVVAKDFVGAAREYEACIERDPADAVAINNKALCLMYSRDLSDSIKLLEGALERVPTTAVNETLVVNLCSMYELAYVNHGEIKKSLSNWIARVAPDDFDPSCTRI